MTSLVRHRDWPPSFCLAVGNPQNSLSPAVVHLSTVLVSSPQAPLLLLLRSSLDTRLGIPPLKILWWDRNGFCLWQKRLERERFRWPEREEKVAEVGVRELGWLLEGLDIEAAHKELHYEAVV